MRYYSCMKISVIIPVYNTAKYLEKCLESVLNQTLKDIEIICIDDGSDDNSLEILQNFAKRDGRIKFLTQKNQGQSVARNVGIKEAQGEYIGFIDSDDWSDATMLEKLYNNAKTYDSDVAMCSINVFNEETGETTDKDPYMTLNVLFDESFENRAFNYTEILNFLFRICVVPWNKIYRREFLIKNNILFPEGLFFEDNVFCTEVLLKAKNISIIKEPLVFYRRASETSTTTGDDIKKLDFFKIMDLQEKLLKEVGLYEQIEDYFQETKKSTLIYWYKKLQDQEVKKEYFIRLKALYSDF